MQYTHTHNIYVNLIFTYYNIFRKLLGPSALIDVYEKDNKIGGRMNAITVNNQTVESGGTFLLDTNRYMVQFAAETGTT